MVCTWQELRSYLLGLGWYEVANTDGGSHYKMRHDDQPGRVVIMVRGRKEMRIGTFVNVCQQAGLNVQELT